MPPPPYTPAPSPSWFASAACAAEPDPDDWHPSVGRGRPKRDLPALAVCRRCPVAADCLDWAMTHRPSGVWGGTTDAQRDAVIRRMEKKKP